MKKLPQNPSIISKSFFILTTFILPLIVIVHWLIRVIPASDIVAFLLFGLPSFLFFQIKSFRNPFFIFPFTSSFILALSHQNWQNFIQDWLILLGAIQVILGLYRTSSPWNQLYLQLFGTLYFRNFFEIRQFWRLTILIILPLIFGLSWFLNPNFYGSY